MAKCIIELKSLKKSFGKEGARIDVLKGIDLEIGAGDMVAVLGASGAGKSTMMHIMGGLEKPTSGSVIYNGQDIYSIGKNSISKLRNEEIGFVFQSHHLLPEFTALENVMMPLLIGRKSRDHASKLGRKLLDEVGLNHRLDHKSGELSGGEQQRVAVARALVMSPKILLADEPTGNLDSKTGEEVFNTIIELNKCKGITFVMVTHNENLALKMGKQVFVRDGRIDN